MSNFTDFIGGGGGLPVNIILGYSQTWVPPVDGNICIHVVGAGGAGLGTGQDDRIKGGGAGGYCKKNSLAVTTSGSFTVVVGAGGDGHYANTPGDDGGNTTVAGTGLGSTLTANGGDGAVFNAHGAGGTASGGDVNNTGGSGGFYGGGAVGITGTGNAPPSGNAGSHQFGASCDVIGPESLMGYGYICGGRGGDSYNVYTPSTTSGTSPTSPPNGGFLAGGGMLGLKGSGNNGDIHGGAGGIGGGGGAAWNNFSQNAVVGGQGGNGIVIIQYLPA